MSKNILKLFFKTILKNNYQIYPSLFLNKYVNFNFFKTKFLFYKFFNECAKIYFFLSKTQIN